MSEGNLYEVMARISGATVSSPIAVFRCRRAQMLNAVFAGTVKTQKMIEHRHPDLIGVYDGTMNLERVQNELARHVL